jgi:hypothetical protein
VEILDQEEVNEEIAIRSGNISKLPSETREIPVPQTPAIFGNVRSQLHVLSVSCILKNIIYDDISFSKKNPGYFYF